MKLRDLELKQPYIAHKGLKKFPKILNYILVGPGNPFLNLNTLLNTTSHDLFGSHTTIEDAKMESGWSGADEDKVYFVKPEKWKQIFGEDAYKKLLEKKVKNKMTELAINQSFHCV